MMNRFAYRLRSGNGKMLLLLLYWYVMSVFRLKIPNVKSCFRFAETTCMFPLSCATLKRFRNRPAVVSTALFAI